VRIGTRASPLALAQARHVASLLGDDTELVEITTSGDRDRALPDKEKWVKELDAALLDGRVDACVHSAKDVPTMLPDGIVIAAVPAREDARDVLVGAPSLDALAPGARVGTSSLRRRAQLLAVRPDLEIVEVRGNVGTRLEKLAAGDVDALVLALAGLRRLGRPEAGRGVPLHGPGFVPAAGQGALAITARAADAATRDALALVDDQRSRLALAAERDVVHALEADCHSAIGVHVAHSADGLADRLRAWIGTPDGTAVITDALDGEAHSPLPVAAMIERLTAMGARELLQAGSRA